MKKILVILFLATGLLSSCKEIANQSMPTDVVFFDLKNFMKTEVVRLNKENPNIKKTTSINGTGETKTIQLKDFGEEFKIFQETDINKLAWIDKYSADTTFANNQIQTIQYKALIEKLTTREMNVSFENGNVSKIEVFTHATSIVTDVEKQMRYEPNISYFILSKQKTSGSEVNEIEVTGEFIK